MNWVGSKMPGLPVRNFTSDWRDGRAIGALVDGVAPGQYHVQASAVRQNFPTQVSRCRPSQVSTGRAAPPAGPGE